MEVMGWPASLVGAAYEWMKRPSRADWYAMRVAKMLAKDSNAPLEAFQVVFEDAAEGPKMSAKTATAIAKARWLPAVGYKEPK